MKNFALALFFFSLCACSRNETQSVQLGASPSPTATAQVNYSETPLTPIRRVDFENFTFPSWPIYAKHEKPFTLKSGDYQGRLHEGAVEPYTVSLVDSVYGDVTGDGDEEAILVLFENVRGTAIPYYVYIYGMDRDQPKLYWAFETGDRAQGGLRRAFAENGKLVVELYGKDTYLGGDLYGGDNQGACCPSHYTRSRYEWKDKRFRRMKDLEVFSTQGGAPYLDSDEQRAP